jgi:chemotaxis protein methyltransferase WspC
MIALADFERLVEGTSGLHAGSIGSSTIERGVRDRLHALGVREIQEYWTRVSQSQEELQSLIEAIVVSETWFFRDTTAFEALKQFVTMDWANRASSDSVLNVLSLPCSTGEEPYSIAMALLDAGLPPQRFRVLGVDISERAVAYARQGIYGRSAFRGQDVTFRDRYFAGDERGQAIADRVRRQVRFRQGNLFSSMFAEPERFDVVFCRNLLIYFDQATQERAIARLTELLAPNGVLFVGSAETGVLLNHSLLSAQLPRAYAFRRQPAAITARPAAHTRPARRPVLATTGATAAAASGRSVPGTKAARPHTPQVPATAVSPAGGDRLLAARQLADQGRFAEAARSCEEQLRVAGPSADAFHLLGLVHDANGDRAAAAGCYRKALYLEPAHGEALIHLALLMEQNGREPEARLLRDRLRRVTGKASS